MIPAEVRAAAERLMRQMEREYEAEDEELHGIRLALFEDSAQEFAWGWALPFSTEEAVAGHELPFPTGPIVVVRPAMRTFVGPSAIPVERLTKYLQDTGALQGEVHG